MKPEETTFLSNTEPLNLRVPSTLKQELETVREFEMVASVGELVRQIVRKHVQEIKATPEFKLWESRRLKKDV